MTPFDNLIGRTINSVTRQDFERNYEYQSPLGIFLRTSEQEGLSFGVLNDGTVELMNDEELYDNNGGEFPENHLNELLDDDELNSLIGEQISSIELAEYITDELQGDNFVLKQGK